MPETTEASTTSLKGNASRRARGFPTAAVASLVVAGGLVPALMYIANWGLWETVWFIKHWGYLIAPTLFVGLCVGVLAWLSFRHRGWWFLCMPSIILWCLVFLLVVACRIDDGEDGLGLHCATVRRAETIDDFEERMSGWGHSPPTHEPEGELERARFQGDLDTSFSVYFDSKTRKIIRWEYCSF